MCGHHFINIYDLHAVLNSPWNFGLQTGQCIWLKTDYRSRVRTYLLEIPFSYWNYFHEIVSCKDFIITIPLWIKSSSWCVSREYARMPQYHDHFHHEYFALFHADIFFFWELLPLKSFMRINNNNYCSQRKWPLGLFVEHSQHLPFKSINMKIKIYLVNLPGNLVHCMYLTTLKCVFSWKFKTHCL